MQEKWNFLSSHASFRITVNGTLTIRSSYLLSNLGQWKKNPVGISRSSDWREENISQGRFAHRWQCAATQWVKNNSEIIGGWISERIFILPNLKIFYQIKCPHDMRLRSFWRLDKNENIVWDLPTFLCSFRKLSFYDILIFSLIHSADLWLKSIIFQWSLKLVKEHFVKKEVVYGK